MYAPVGLDLEFQLPLVPIDVDSDDLVITFTELEQNPVWVSLSNNILYGIPTMLGEYPIYLSLSDGQATVLDTFNINVENFR